MALRMSSYSMSPGSASCQEVHGGARLGGSVTSEPCERLRCRLREVTCRACRRGPSRRSAPLASRTTRLSILLETTNEMRVGMLALMRPVMTFVEGRWVASTRWMPTARLFWARRVIESSTSLPFVSITSASSSIDDHEVGHVVGQLSSSRPARSRAFSRLLLRELVVAGDVAHAAGEQPSSSAPPCARRPTRGSWPRGACP